MEADELTALPVSEFLDRLASGSPTPGGGSSSALAGALAASLVSMVCHLTLGRPKFAAVEAEVRSLLADSEAVRSRLTVAVAADADAYGAVVAGMRLPRGSDEERVRRHDTLQTATAAAARVPLGVAEDCAAVIGLCQVARPITNPNVASDLTVAAALAAGACEGAAANVEENLANLDDASLVEELSRRLASARSGCAQGASTT
jgi:formiminotetrahydrofolate cyclodeaminase